jgi:hypothetical protein
MKERGRTLPQESKRLATRSRLARADLSQFSHGLTGRCWTMASMPDTRQDADLRIRIPAHRPDMLH